jgi:hypothetical protein
MKLIFIYGLPAVGKLTVARELSNMTGFGVVHGHLVNDLIGVIFGFGSKSFLKYNHKTRLMLFEGACKERVKGLIFTFGYHNDNDEDRAKDIVNIVKKNKGEVYFVKLIADKDNIIKRAMSDDRKKFGKIKTKSLIKKVLDNKNYAKRMNFEPTLEIDNSNLSAKKVAGMIKEEFKL